MFNRWASKGEAKMLRKIILLKVQADLVQDAIIQFLKIVSKNFCSNHKVCLGYQTVHNVHPSPPLACPLLISYMNPSIIY